MSLEDFHLLDNEPIDNSIIKRDYLKTYHQQAALLNDPDQNLEFIFGENDKYNQVGNSHLGFDLALRKAAGNKFNFIDNPATKEVVRLVNNVFDYCFKEADLSNIRGMEIEQLNFLGQVATIRRVFTSKDAELLS